MKKLIAGILLMSSLTVLANDKCNLSVNYDTTDNINSPIFNEVSEEKIAEILRSKGYKVSLTSNNAFNDFDGSPTLTLKTEAWDQHMRFHDSSKNLVRLGVTIQILNINGTEMAKKSSYTKRDGRFAAWFNFKNHLKSALKDLPPCSRLKK